MEGLVVNNRKSQRLSKIQNKKYSKKFYVSDNTPSNLAYKRFYQLADRLGYNYEKTESSALFEAHENFTNQVAQHYDHQYQVKKKGRKGKYEDNLKHGRLQRNPLLTKIENLSSAMQPLLKRQAIESLKNW